MILKAWELVETLKQKQPYHALRRMAKNGEIFPIIRGLYETEKDTPGEYLAASIYGPSYLSFEYALAYYDLIPERVVAYSSATFGKNRRKSFNTPFGRFYYRDVPRQAYPYGIGMVRDENRVALIALPEKAICDELYIKRPVHSVKRLQFLLFDDLRIDEDDFFELDKEKLMLYASQYASTNMKYLHKFVEKEL